MVLEPSVFVVYCLNVTVWALQPLIALYTLIDSLWYGSTPTVNVGMRVLCVRTARSRTVYIITPRVLPLKLAESCYGEPAACVSTGLGRSIPKPLINRRVPGRGGV